MCKTWLSLKFNSRELWRKVEWRHPSSLSTGLEPPFYFKVSWKLNPAHTIRCYTVYYQCMLRDDVPCPDTPHVCSLMYRQQRGPAKGWKNQSVDSIMKKIASFKLHVAVALCRTIDRFAERANSSLPFILWTYLPDVALQFNFPSNRAFCFQRL